MADYLVTMTGESREVYAVTADSEEEARANWQEGHLVVQESSSMEVDDVRLDD